jgi:hypothetical protein
MREQNLRWLSGVVRFAVNRRMIVEGLQMRDDFSGSSDFIRQPFFQDCSQSVCLTNRRQVRKQEMDFDDLPISCRAETYAVITDSEFVAECIEFLADPLSRNGIAIVEKSHRGVPYQLPA